VHARRRGRPSAPGESRMQCSTHARMSAPSDSRPFCSSSPYASRVSFLHWKQNVEPVLLCCSTQDSRSVETKIDSTICRVLMNLHVLLPGRLALQNIRTDGVFQHVRAAAKSSPLVEAHARLARPDDQALQILLLSPCQYMGHEPGANPLA